MATACAVVSLTVASFAARVMLCATSAPLMAMSSAAARMLPDTLHELTAMDWPAARMSLGAAVFVNSLLWPNQTMSSPNMPLASSAISSADQAWVSSA